MSKSKKSKGFSPYSRKKDSSPGLHKPAQKIGATRPASAKPKEAPAPTGSEVRLNKFIANSGVCSRREADLLISSGQVTVNGHVVTELGTKVQPTDTVLYKGEKLKTEKKVYVLLNKPKDYITTATDPQGRRTVMDLVKNAGNHRLFPVGRLDRNTTGLLLMTNDGELTKKLTHPKHGVRKLYNVLLDRPLTKNDMEKIKQGVELDGETIVPDELAYSGQDGNKTNIGIELHSGQNRVVRRIFETFDYKVLKLDRITFAGLTKKDLPRGHWRYLTDKEVGFLMMIK
jgi:23S rRNA pseudouridine2605 synthase